MCGCERPSRAPDPTVTSSPGAVAMRYVGETAVVLRGPLSRRVYVLNPGMTVPDVDARDALAFSTSPLFETL